MMEVSSTGVPTPADYIELARLRHALRQFMRFSEQAARAVGLPPQQHQALLAIKSRGDQAATVGWLAEQLLITPHTCTELVNRLVKANRLRRDADPADGRRQVLSLTPTAQALVARLSEVHLQEIRLLAPELMAVLRKLTT